MAHVLACDIGGTNCRLARFSLSKGGLALEGQTAVSTAQVARSADLVCALASAFGEAPVREAAALGVSVAGPVAGGRARLTNAKLDLAGEELSQMLGGKPCRLANDFEAVSAAVLTEEGARAELVAGEPCPDALAVRACCGAGTGFGCSAVMPRADGKALILASEGGHAAFPFTPAEAPFQRWLTARRGAGPYASVEDVLSGRGLEGLAEFLDLAGMDAAEIGEAVLGQDEWWEPSAMPGEGRTARAKRELCASYARFYGRACRDWMLATLCRGGLWIAGGIAVKNRAIARSRAFRDEIVQGRHAAMLKTFPVYLFMSEAAGLWGAARLAWDLA